jgi:hypothetical protein
MSDDPEDVVFREVIFQVLEPDLDSRYALSDVLLDATSEEESEREMGVLLEEIQQLHDELLDASMILTFVETIYNDEEWALRAARRPSGCGSLL